LSENLGACIVAAVLVTALIRLVPVLYLSGRNFPVLVRDFLSFVPVAVLSAIVTAEVMGNEQTTVFELPLSLTAALMALIVGLLTRSLFATVIASILAFLLLQNL